MPHVYADNNNLHAMFRPTSAYSLAPALFALGQHGAPLKAASALHASDSLLAFLDDLYVMTTRERACAARDTVVGVVKAEWGIASNEG